MSTLKKRKYHSVVRKAQLRQTKSNILAAAKKLYQSKGFDQVTINEIAEEASVSAPSIYAIFESKKGILKALIDMALPQEKYQTLVEGMIKETCPRKRLEFTAHLSRLMYDAEKQQINLLRGASILDKEFQKLEQSMENRRYQRQEASIKDQVTKGVFKENLSLDKIRDIIWAFTGRDLYRMFVIERGWSSDEYELWLSQTLITLLLK